MLSSITSLQIEKSNRGGKWLVFKIDLTNSKGKNSLWCRESSTCKDQLHNVYFQLPIIEIFAEHDHAKKPARIEVRSCKRD